MIPPAGLSFPVNWAIKSYQDGYCCHPEQGEGSKPPGIENSTDDWAIPNHFDFAAPCCQQDRYGVYSRMLRIYFSNKKPGYPSLRVGRNRVSSNRAQHETGSRIPAQTDGGACHCAQNAPQNNSLPGGRAYALIRP